MRESCGERDVMVMMWWTREYVSRERAITTASTTHVALPLTILRIFRCCAQCGCCGNTASHANEARDTRETLTSADFVTKICSVKRSRELSVLVRR